MGKNKKPLNQIKQENNEVWYKNLPMDKHMFIEQRTKKKLDGIQAETELILDSCYISAMIEEMDIDLDNCIKIAQKANVNMRITEQILKTEGENYYMKVNNEELRSQIRKEAKEMLKSNPKISTLNVSDELKKEYLLPTKDLHIIVAEARKEIKEENKADKELKEVIEKHSPKEEIPYTVTEKEIEENKVNFEQAIGITNERGIEISEKVVEVAREIKIIVPSKLKVIEQTIKVEGECGTYIKDSQGVSCGDKNFKDIKEVEGYKIDIEGDYTKTKDEINQQISDLKQELIEVSKKHWNKLKAVEEIEQVFAM